MAAGDTNYPAQLDTDENLPDLTGYRQSGYLDTDGVTYDEHRQAHNWTNTIRQAVLALQAKVGIGGSSPSGSRILQASEGGSAWVTLASIAASALGRGAGAALQVLRVKADETGLEWWTVPTDDDPATASLRTLGTGAQQAAAGNDARLSDARTPVAHADTHAAGEADEVTPAAIGAATIAHAATHATGGTDEVTPAAIGAPTTDDLGTVADAVTALDGALTDHVAVTGADGHVAQQAAIGDVTPTTITDPADAPADADALREDLVANVLPDIDARFDAVEAKVNAILAALRTAEVLET
ncbi:hypothetical protein [Euzebya sp.]|uniref:hypothetical protein n=1 Tax=Euzebya sp. TaxID=1971409 RepID=UPI003519755B